VGGVLWGGDVGGDCLGCWAKTAVAMSNTNANKMGFIGTSFAFYFDARKRHNAHKIGAAQIPFEWKDLPFK
jgi:hypothetical protein